jgi:aminomethyltransferase
VELSEVGTELAVETPTRKAGATVVPKPFVDPKKEIPKS